MAHFVLVGAQSRDHRSRRRASVNVLVRVGLLREADKTGSKSDNEIGVLDFELIRKN